MKELAPSPARVRAMRGIADRTNAHPCGSAEHQLFQRLIAAGLVRYDAQGSTVGYRVTDNGLRWMRKHDALWEPINPLQAREYQREMARIVSHGNMPSR